MKMYHKDSDGSIEVHPSQVKNAKRLGWTEEKPSNKSQSKSTEESKK